VSNLEQVEILSQLDDDLEQVNMVAYAEEINTESEIPEYIDKLKKCLGSTPYSWLPKSTSCENV